MGVETSVGWELGRQQAVSEKQDGRRMVVAESDSLLLTVYVWITQREEGRELQRNPTMAEPAPDKGFRDPFN